MDFAILILAFFGRFLYFLLFLPVILVLATPFILIKALYGPEGYFDNVLEGYRSTIEFWLNTFQYFLL